MPIIFFLIFLTGFTIGFMWMKSISDYNVKWKEFHFKSFQLANQAALEENEEKKLKLLNELNNHLGTVSKI